MPRWRFRRGAGLRPVGLVASFPARRAEVLEERFFELLAVEFFFNFLIFNFFFQFLSVDLFFPYMDPAIQE